MSVEDDLRPVPSHDLLRALRAEVNELIEALPGPITSVTARVGECSVEISWAQAAPIVQTIAAPPVAAQPLAQPLAAAPVAEAAAAAPVEAPASHKVIKSPIVGTFYAAPEPGAAPFVRAGDIVTAGQDVAIVEAMKLMNRLQSDWSGTVVEVLVADGDPLEFDQPLVVIDVADD
nr:acetyl-CoA carboxylase biotin carboxyl carrier protein [Kibdelosporangium sp. MJ126-NF4]CEL19970.1 Biotin carboxyl carrier protein of acetyl-CoA carboxylase [Kibdelosporangium sp. MJ126-NF4]CTQ97194.1 Biotin carboxyl carrier protein of acetyl-CoA carboxylase [Kibdelosporangium sp. MJ126-NF4]